MHKVGAYQSSLKIVECCPCHGKPLYCIQRFLDNRKQKYYKLYGDARQSEGI